MEGHIYWNAPTSWQSPGLTIESVGGASTREREIISSTNSTKCYSCTFPTINSNSIAEDVL